MTRENLVANSFKLSHTTTVKMGCGMSAEEKEQRKLNDEIDMGIRKEKMALAKEVKMLLLGLLL